MKRIIFILVIFILVVLISLFFGVSRKEELQKKEFKGPQGAPFVRGPFSPPPSQ